MLRNILKSTCVLFICLINLLFIHESHAVFTCKIDGEVFTDENAVWLVDYNDPRGPQGYILTDSTKSKDFWIQVNGDFEVKTYTISNDLNSELGASYYDFSSSPPFSCVTESGTLTIWSKIGDRLKGTFRFTMRAYVVGTDEEFMVEVTNGSFDLLTETSQTTSTTTVTIPNEICPSELIYGHSEETEMLRYFRDRPLNQTQEGRELIRLYYLWSPIIVQAMEEDEDFKKEVKEIIDGFLPLLRNHLEKY